nr:MAG TPA: hypothetical protein [Caudoviricetes sp.]
MKFTETSITSSPEILKRRLGGELFVPVTVASASFTNGVCKAGTPLSRLGAIDTSTPAGILLNDVYSDNPNGSLIMAFATINTAVAATHSGVTYTDTIKAALPNIVFD